MNIASASNLKVAYGHHIILDGLTFAIEQGERVGLVGRNGCGKSTFLKIAAGQSQPDSGEFITAKDLVSGYLSQDFTLRDEASVLDNVLDGAAFLRELIAEYEALPPESHRAAELMEQISHFDGWTLDQRALSLINELHAPAPERPVAQLSGGEKRRVALCRALIAEPDFLILDEPTNHLDTEAIEWLEQFLLKYRGTVLFVTHDRYFLDNITTRIVEIRGGQADSYEGNYTDYLLARAERDEAEARAEHKRQRFLTKELEWVRRRPSARRTKSRDRLEKFFEIKAQEGPEEEIDVDLIIPQPPKLSNRVIEAQGISKSLGGKTLFSHFDFNLEPGERIGIVGRNGLGKSTLLKVLLGLESPDTGEVEIGTRADINFIDQNRLLVDDQKSVYDEVGEGVDYVQLGTEKIGLRAYLRRFLFSEDRINTKIELLSGGERSRVLLAKILKRGGNVLVLDEPTNDLDLATLRVLEEALLHFPGCVLTVSHDRYFLNRICTAILAFEGEGHLHYQPGGYDYYLEKKQQRLSPITRSDKTSKPQSPAPAEPKAVKAKKLSNKEREELSGMEERILESEARIEEINAAFNAPDFYEKFGDSWQQMEEELEQLKKLVPQLYDRWEALEARAHL